MHGDIYCLLEKYRHCELFLYNLQVYIYFFLSVLELLESFNFSLFGSGSGIFETAIEESCVRLECLPPNIPDEAGSASCTNGNLIGSTCT